MKFLLSFSGFILYSWIETQSSARKVFPSLILYFSHQSVEENHQKKETHKNIIDSSMSETENNQGWAGLGWG